MRRYLIVAMSATLLLACAKPSAPDATLVTVYKSPTCQCCSRWLAHLEEHGFATKVESQRDLRPVRARLGVPDKLASCHTAVVNGYFVEGHVPAEDVKRLLAEKPRALGIAAPGMPVGSPGMEMGERRDPYDVVLFDASGNTQVFAHHSGAPAASPGSSTPETH